MQGAFEEAILPYYLCAPTIVPIAVDMINSEFPIGPPAMNWPGLIGYGIGDALHADEW